MSLDFIVRIFRIDDEQQPEFLGTGVVIAPDCILTCRHVVVEESLGAFYPEQATPTELLRIKTGDGNKALSIKEVITDKRWDLALLRLATPLNVTTPVFLKNITRQYSSYLADSQLEAFGYPGTEYGDSLWRQPVTPKMQSFRSESDHLASLQLDGGLPAGCSGGPVLLEYQDQQLCIGINYLGGEEAASSRLIAADIVLEFLQEHTTEPPPQISTKTVFSNFKQRFKTLMVSFVVVFVMTLLSLSPPLQKLDDFFTDLLFTLRGSSEIPEEIIIVKIGDPSMAAINQSWPWSRDIHAQLTEALFRNGAKTVVFDILFAEPSETESDQRFAEVLNRYASQIVLASQLYAETNSFGIHKRWSRPHSMFLTEDTAIGFTNLTPRRGVVRSLLARSEDQFALSYQAAERFSGISEESDTEIDINFVGPSGSIRNIEYYQALKPEEFLPPDFFRNKLVFIGSMTNIGGSDVFATPFTSFSNDYMYGVELHANATHSFTTNSYLTSPSSLLTLAASLLIGISFCVLFFVCTTVRHNWILLMAIIIFAVAWSTLFLYQAYVLPAMPFLLPIFTVFLMKPIVFAHFPKNEKT